MSEADLLAAQIVSLAEARLFDELESLWLERLDDLPTQPAVLKEFLKHMKKAGELARAESLAAMLVEARLEANKPKTALRALLTFIPAWPQSAALRPLLIKALRAVTPDRDSYDTILTASGLDSGGSRVEGYKTFVELQRLAPGQVWQHTEWREGEIIELDTAERRVVLRFASHPRKEMTIDGVKNYLKYIEPERFLAQKTRDPESLAKLAETDPAELVKRALADQTDRTIKQGDLKQLLLGGIIDTNDWSSWWGKAREALKLDPFVDFDASGGAHAAIKLRERPRTFSEEIEERFFDPDADTAIRAEIIRQLAKRPGDAVVSPDLIRRMAMRIKEAWALSDESNVARRLQLAFMLADLAIAMPSENIETFPTEPLFAAVTDYSQLFELNNVEYGIRALAELVRRDGEDGVRQAAAILPKAPVRLAQAIWQALDEEHHIEDAVRALEDLMQNPLDNPETYAWAVRSMLDGSWGHLEDYFPAQAVVPEILDAMEEWLTISTGDKASSEEKAAAKSLISKMRTLLAANHGAVFGAAVESMTREAAQRLRHKIELNEALPTPLRAQAVRTIRLTRRDLEESAGTVEPADEAHECTEASYAAKAAELREIASVKIPKNSKVIEEARMEGDLRENAVYQYAKEEQKMLLQTQATLTDLLGRARIFRASDVDTSKIGFGTRVAMRNLTSNAEEVYTILGRWEADAEHHILSKQAPMAEQFIGHTVGDQVTIKHPGGGSTPYEIISIENALQGQ
ncbi:GreA/GreB family elongation factor [bacterium]|nr:GreA/GreB family elongation factor [bacterium]